MSVSRELLPWLGLARLCYSRPRLAFRLIEAAGSPAAVFGLDPDLVRALLRRAVRVAERVIAFSDWHRCEEDLAHCARTGITILTYDDDRYPPLLRMIDDPPVVLFVRGDPLLLSAHPCIAVIGARKSTAFGRDRAFRLARDLAQRGIAVVSGMAYGVDAAAHEGALNIAGRTVSVWGTGPDVVYPSAKRELAARIIANGAIVTEFPLTTGPAPHHFPQRNRIISGLALGVVVVEATARSGSLITVDFALEQGREVCALPGAAGLVAHGGNNRLIKEGACLVESADDIMEAVFALDAAAILRKKTGQAKRGSARQARLEVAADDRCASVRRNAEHEDELLAAIGHEEALSLDRLIQETGGNSAGVMERLTRLEIEGLIEELPGKRYRRTMR